MTRPREGEPTISVVSVTIVESRTFVYFTFFNDNLSRVERTVFFAKETAKEMAENYCVVIESRVTAGLTKYDAFATRERRREIIIYS